MEIMVWKTIDSSDLTWGEWDDVKSSVRAQVFGKMVNLARDRVNYYRGDLFHDALWLNERITGEMEFDWVARESGTFIGESAIHIKVSDWPQAVKYRFDIRRQNDLKWVLDIHEAVVDTGNSVMWENGRCLACGNGNHSGDCYQDVCTSDDPNDHQGNTCPVHEENFELPEDIKPYFELPEDIKPYFSDEPISDSVRECMELLNPAQILVDEIFKARVPEDFPTLRNETTRKENKMESILRDLRDKYEEASNTKDQLEEYQNNINDAIDELDTYMSDLDSLIDSLDSLPEVSVYCDLDTVSFDS